MAKRIATSLHKALILKGNDRLTAVDQMLSHLFQCKDVGNPQEVNRIIKDREEAMSSGIGSGISVPHVRHDGIAKITVIFGLSINGIGWLSPDYAPVNFVCLFAAPKDDPDDYLETLGSYLSKLRDNKFRNKLLKSRTDKELSNLWLGKTRHATN